MGKIVYSSDPDWKELCPKCHEFVDQCICTPDTMHAPKKRTVYLTRDRKKRKGKTVTIISNLNDDLKTLKRDLQQHCGAGGTLKNDTIEIQGDHRKKIQQFLEQKGYKVKIAGG
jgi:translation initiation factor 1